MTDVKKPEITGDGAVELEETVLDQTSGGPGADGIGYSEPPDPSRLADISGNKFNPGTIGSVKLRP